MTSPPPDETVVWLALALRDARVNTSPMFTSTWLTPAVASWLLFGIGCLGAVSVLLTRFPVRWPGFMALAGFGWSWLAGELVWHSACFIWGLGALFAAFGGLGAWPGVVGAILGVALVDPIIRANRDAAALKAAAPRWLGEPLPDHIPKPRWSPFLFFMFHARWSCREHHRYGPERAEVADVYRPRDATLRNGRVMLYVHGGGWVLGFRRWQGRILFRRLVRAGWTVVSVEYRLSPWATWPAPIVDVKRAIAWVKANPQVTGYTPGLLAISGNSAGGHLASLAALTAGKLEFQPGFEQADTSVNACLCWYGVYDIIDRHRRWRHRGLKHLWELLVVKRRFSREPEVFRSASPLEHALAGAAHPPFAFIHGAIDSLVPPDGANDLAAVLGDAPVVMVPGAQHAFDVFWSKRAVIATEIAARWLEKTL